MGMETIVNPEPSPAIQKDTRLPQNGKVAGDLGLGQVQGRREIADTTLSARQQEHENTQPGKVGKDAGQLFRGRGHEGRLGDLDR